MLLDGAYVQQVFVDALQVTESESKKLTRTILTSYIVSHAEAWRNVSARSALISAVQRIVDEKRSSLFQTFITDALEPVSEHSLAGNAVEAEEYWSLVLKALRTRNLSDEAALLFTRVLKDSRTDMFISSLRAKVRSAMVDWVLKAASPNQRFEIFESASSVARAGEIVSTLTPGFSFID